MKTLLPTKLWGQISTSLSSISFVKAATVFKGLEQYSPIRSTRIRAHAALWERIFKDDTWLRIAEQKDADFILIGADLNALYNKRTSEQEQKQTKQLCISLCMVDRSGDLQYTFTQFHKSLRPEFKKTKQDEYISEGLILKSLYYLPDGYYEINNDKIRYLFSGWPNGPLQTSYCFWDDNTGKLRDVKPKDIRGIDGEVSTAKDLAPGFFLNLYPPGGSSSIPIQLVFNYYRPLRGISPFEWVFKDRGNPRSISTAIIDHFRFRDERDKDERYRVQDWTYLAAYRGSYSVATDASAEGREVRAERMKPY
jgi:hypothetical protein